MRALVFFSLLLGAASAGAVPPLEGDEERPGGGSGFMGCELGHLPQEIFSFGFSPLALASPSPFSTGAPRNAELVLSGFLGDLDFEPPFVELKLLDDDEREVPFERRAHVIRPLELLQPFHRYRLVLDGTDSCPGCGGFEEWSFTTGGRVDHVGPALTEVPRAQVLVPSEGDAGCGFVRSASEHVVIAEVGPLPADVARLVVTARTPDGAPERVFDGLPPGPVLLAHGQGFLGLHDRVIVAFTPIDAAGNPGTAVIVRVRARPLDDARSEPFHQLDERQCELPASPLVAMPEALPTNGRLVVDFPLEPVPLALRGEGALIPLQPASSGAGARVLVPTAPLPAGASLALEALPCEHCACPGCDLVAHAALTVGDGRDDTAPAPPAVLALREDLDPPASTGACHAERTALVVILEAGEDDQTPPEHLRYDADLRLDGRLPVEVGRLLPAAARGDGTYAVRLDSARYGRLLPEDFDLTLRAVDLAGNASEAEHRHEAGKAGGCSSTGRAGGPALALLLLLLGLIRPARARLR